MNHSGLSTQHSALSTQHSALTIAERRGLMEVALGRAPADLAIRNARVLNVFTGELLAGQDVATRGQHIAYVGPDARFAIGERTKVVEADGQTLLPGFIDGHTHLATRYGVEEFVRYAAPGGTTTVITELIELASVSGLQGITAMLDALVDQPIAFFGTLPPLAALAPFMEQPAPSLDQYRALLARDDVVGLGELPWGNLLREVLRPAQDERPPAPGELVEPPAQVLRPAQDERLLELVVETQRAGRVAEGHSAGARGQRLVAYACAGIGSCHEPITAEEGLERLRLGLHWMAREGEIRRDLEAFAPLWREQRVDLRRFILATDSVGPRRLLEQGYLDQAVRRAIALGLDPIKAVQAVTLNVAEHYRLDHLLGAIAPGRRADLVLAPDLRDLRAGAVYSRGRLVARDGALVVEPRPTSFPRRMLVSVRRPRLLTPADFRVPAHGAARARVRAIELVTHLVTREAEVSLATEAGEVRPNPEQDVLKVAAIHRSGKSADLFVGFIRGFGLRAGALATSMAWDSQCMIVVGADERDMARAADRLIDVQGGAAVFAHGELLAEFQAPIGGIISPAPLPEIVRDPDAVARALRHQGSRLEDPLLAADVLTTAAIPHLRITERGYVRLKDGALLGLWLE
ncbi:MAG: adenine deaminase [Chloroflexi bacterium]|nr:adenine deaminase [Chloroflexota bacterium]